MALKVRQRRKIAKKATDKLGGEVALGVAVASGGPEPRMLRWGFNAACVALFAVLWVLNKEVIPPGALVARVVYFCLDKPRYAVLTPHGLAVLKNDFFNQPADRVTTRVDAGVLDRPVRTASGKRQVDVGPERIWIKDSEVAALRAGVA